MGSSKIILVSGLCVMLGFYAYVIQKASSAIVMNGTERRAQTQARMLSNAAVNMANYELSTPGNEAYYNMTAMPMSGGTMSWNISTAGMPNEARVTAIGVFGVDTVVQRATLGKTSVIPSFRGRHQWNQWGVEKIYSDAPTDKQESIAEAVR
jgi:hypothetical protein